MDDFVGHRLDFEAPIDWALTIPGKFQRKPYTTEELFVSLANLLRQHKLAIEESRTLYWRFAHPFIKKPDESLIEIDGMRLRQLYEFFDAYVPNHINVGHTYTLRVEELERLLNAANETIEQLDD